MIFLETIFAECSPGGFVRMPWGYLDIPMNTIVQVVNIGYPGDGYVHVAYSGNNDALYALPKDYFDNSLPYSYGDDNAN